MRVAISKRQRFETFKRDGFACQYCGRTPPGVTLEVDHITPVAEGGENEPDNLVTACFDCNRGKAAVPLTAVPLSLADKAAMVAEQEAQLRGYQDILRAKRERVEDDAWEVMRTIFPGCTETKIEWLRSVKRFLEKLGLDACIEAAEVARAAPVYSDGRTFRYFCGVCWNLISDMEGRPR